MKIGMINGSPKSKESNSEFLLENVKELIAADNTFLEYNINKHALSPEQYDELCDCDALIFGFPLYIDAIPSHLLRMLIELQNCLERKNQKNITVYAIVNCGFYEGQQNHIAIEMMKNWCRKAGLVWGQGIGSGAGEMVGVTKNIPMGHGTNTDLGKALNNMANHMNHLQSGDTIFVSPNFPRFAWKICASMLVWNPRAKANGLKKKDLFYRQNQKI